MESGNIDAYQLNNNGEIVINFTVNGSSMSPTFYLHFRKLTHDQYQHKFKRYQRKHFFSVEKKFRIYNLAKKQIRHFLTNLIFNLSYLNLGDFISSEASFKMKIEEGTKLSITSKNSAIDAWGLETVARFFLQTRAREYLRQKSLKTTQLTLIPF